MPSRNLVSAQNLMFVLTATLVIASTLICGLIVKASIPAFLVAYVVVLAFTGALVAVVNRFLADTGDGDELSGVVQR